jgi:hypothetical protein
LFFLPTDDDELRDVLVRTEASEDRWMVAPGCDE